MSSETQNLPNPACKNCNHPIPLHKPICSFKEAENAGDICGCQNAQYYNTLVSAEHIGWEEIHFNSCGVLTSFIDSTLENISDFTILCPKCIAKISRTLGDTHRVDR
jgi:hypothetical protein